MTNQAHWSQWIVVATALLMAAPPTSTGVTIRNDRIGAFQNEFDYLCRTLRRLGVPSTDFEDLPSFTAYSRLSKARKELEATLLAIQKRTPS